MAMPASMAARSISMAGERVGTSGEGVTVTLAVAEVLAVVASGVVVAAVAVFDTVPLAEISVFTTRVNVVDAPLFRVAIEKWTVPFAPTAGVVQVNAGPLWASETKVVCGDRASAMVTLAAFDAPILDAVIVQVMGAPATSVGGAPLLVTATSACSVTFVVAVEEVFEGFVSVVVVVTLAVLDTLPETLPAVLMTSVNVALAPLATAARLQVTGPPAPTAGFVQLKAGPLFWVLETKVVFAGRVSVSCTVLAGEAPPLAAGMG